MPDPTTSPPPHFIVFVPGFLGSKLCETATGETVWVDFSRVPLNPLEWEGWLDRLFNAMRYPNPDLTPAGVIEDVLFAPPWIKQEQYSRLIRELEALGYRADPTSHSEAELDVYLFAYDWRQDNRISGRQLGAAIERWSAFHPGAQVWLMAHSNGGVASRWYIEKEGGKDRVSRLILVASPWDGAVKAMQMLFNGFDTLFRFRFNLFGIPQRTRELLRTFPAIFQLIPHQAQFLSDAETHALDPFIGADWLDDPGARALLADAQRFNSELGSDLSVETLVFFGRKMPTTTTGTVRLGAGQHWDAIDWLQTEAGDGTLTERAAVFDKAHQNIPVIAGHGDIYVNPALYEILRWELVDKYKGGARAALRTDRLAVTFVPDSDNYQSGAAINLRATVHRTLDGTPVADASIHVDLVWRQPLPGSGQTKPPRRLPSVDLAATPAAPGQYEGKLAAPAAEGYYRLDATVVVPLEQPLELQELIAVEANASTVAVKPKSRTANKKRSLAAKPKSRAAKKKSSPAAKPKPRTAKKKRSPSH